MNVDCPKHHNVVTAFAPLDRTYMYCCMCKEYFSVHEYERENVETKERSDRELIADRNVIKLNRELEVQFAPYRWRLAL